MQRDPVSLGELTRHDQRVRLRQEDERVVDDRLVGGFEVVVAKAAVAGHVDAEHQQAALTGDAAT